MALRCFGWTVKPGESVFVSMAIARGEVRWAVDVVTAMSDVMSLLQARVTVVAGTKNSVFAP